MNQCESTGTMLVDGPVQIQCSKGAGHEGAHSAQVELTWTAEVKSI